MKTKQPWEIAYEKANEERKAGHRIKFFVGNYDTVSFLAGYNKGYEYLLLKYRQLVKRSEELEQRLKILEVLASEVKKQGGNV